MISPLAAKLAWGAGMIAWAVIRYPYARRARKNGITRRETSPREKILLFDCLLGLFIIPLIYAVTDWPQAAAYPPNVILFVVGAALFVFSLWLFYRSHKDLGRQWSVTLAIRDKHALINQGVYRLIRHPMYASFWLWGLAQAFLLPNFVAGLAGLASVAALFFMRIDNEERMMLETFGDEYRGSVAQTKRIIPFVY
jgi:protein-S-isoprenylcysteine O-methyltransferase Ste14